MRQTGPDGFWVSDDRSLLDVRRVHDWLSGETYWAKNRSMEATIRAIDNSLALGLYAPDGTQLGFARLVTDRTTFAWICDVFVDASCRGRGLGSFMIQAASGHPDIVGLRQVLKGAPERSIYRRVGFSDLVNADRWLELPADEDHS